MTVPSYGVAMEEALVVEWLLQPGAPVKVDQPLTRRDEWVAVAVFDTLADEALAAFDRLVEGHRHPQSQERGVFDHRAEKLCGDKGHC